MDGPGTGRDMRLGYGITTLGRGESCDIVLDFGDEKISRSPNCRVVVDPNSQACFVRQDGGRNLVYLNDNPVLSPSTVTSGDRITIGETVLMLIRVSPDFVDWSSNDSRN